MRGFINLRLIYAALRCQQHQQLEFKTCFDNIKNIVFFIGCPPVISYFQWDNLAMEVNFSYVKNLDKDQ